jgi:Glycosyltransferase family 87
VARALRQPGYSSGNERFRSLRTVLIPLAIVLGLWLAATYEHGKIAEGPNARAFGSDFAMYWTAARLLQSGENPYAHARLVQSLRGYFHQNKIPIMESGSIPQVSNVPTLYWAIQPMLRLPFQQAAWLWILLMYALCLAGFLAALRYLAWTVTLVPSLVFLAMPQTVTAVFYANVQAPMFAGLVGSLALMKRSAFGAGMLASVAWLKPQIGLPLALLIGLFHTSNRVRFLGGFTAVTLGLFALPTIFANGHVMEWWVRELIVFHGTMDVQPNNAALTGLYVLWAPHSTHLIFEIISLATAGLLTGFLWQILRGSKTLPFLLTGWLWFVWFVAVPYVHFPDEILLTVPVLAFLGRNGERLLDRSSLLIVYVLAAQVLLFPVTPPYVQVLSLPLLLVAVFLFMAAREHLSSTLLREELQR